jgi:hypothetical protein
VESGRERVDGQVGEAKEVDGATPIGGEGERGSVPLGACWRWITIG